MNDPDVMTALHAKLPKQASSWESCSNIVRYDYSNLLTPMRDNYDYILSKMPNMKILFYSGDLDGILPSKGTHDFVKAFGNKVTTGYRSWNTVEGQVGGYAAHYGNVAFTTIRGAGHEVPADQPERFLHMLNHWLQNKSF
eukprot:TRINITY_DN3276_c0_g1_i3.p2 TRINITY_DN3276_c0_g1~~TRINITY_DN3276_c0_g1_i3.p2  ORF type:complete len:140 (-),score=40.42 TRINITY_DN3276_c0_g1_i3:42-461(-)